MESILRCDTLHFLFYNRAYELLAPMIKCKKTPGKKCRFMAEGKKKR